MKKYNSNLGLNYYESHNQEIGALETKKDQAEYFLKRINKDYLNNREKVLDVGCGLGVLGQLIKEKYNSDVFGIDLAESAIKIARKQGVAAKKSDINDRWPYKESFFDVVVCVQVLEHLYNPDFFFEEAKRVLKNNGFLVISTPNLAAWYNRIIFLFGYQPFFTEVSTIDKTLGLGFTRDMTPNREVVGHLRIFTLKALIDMSKMYGFETVDIKGGSVKYLPKYMRPIDKFMERVPSLSSDIILIAKKK